MDVIIESMTGRMTRLTINPLETVKGLKARIWKTEGVPLSQQSLVFKNQELDDSRQLQEYNIVGGSVVKLFLITRSGPMNFKSRTDGEISVSNLVEYLQNASLPGTSADEVNRVGLMVLRDGDHLNWYHLVDHNQPPIENNSIVGLSSETTDPPASDPSKSESRRVSAAKRAEENYRTMLRMRELRHSMERLNQERCRRRQTNGVEDVQCQDDTTNNRQRRSSGSSSATAIRMRPSKTFPISNAFLVTNSNNGTHFMSAAEDTSAKESSAGETEFEDCHPVYNLPPLHNVISDDFESTSLNGIKIKSKNHVHLFANNNFSTKFSPNDAVAPIGASSKHVCLKRDPLKFKHFHILSSSCSDMEPDSSVLFSSDYEAVPTSDQDQELYTAEDCWSYEENEQGENDFDDGEQNLYISDYHDAIGGREDEINIGVGPNPLLNSKSLTSFNDKDLETTASDPSELSSGAIICDLAMNSRRSKVRRKYFGQRHLTKRPQLVTSQSFRVPIDESEEQSSTTFEINALKINGIQEFTNRPRASHQGRFGPRRARSKPRLIANKATSTGESSSDERDCHRDSSPGSVSHSLNEKNRQVSLAKNFTNNGKQKAVVGTRLISTSKKFSMEKVRPVMNQFSVSSNFAPGVGFYPSVSTSPSGSVPGVVRNHKLPQSSQSQQRCNICGCRLNLSTTFQCRCGKTVCPRHRTSDLHSCGYEVRRDQVNVTDCRKQSSEHLPKL